MLLLVAVGIEWTLGSFRLYRDAAQQLTHYEASDIRRDALSGWRIAGVNLLGELLPNEAAVPQWEMRVDGWYEGTRETLLKYFGKATADSIMVLGTYDHDEPFVGSVNERHRKKRLMLKRRLENIKSLLERDSR